MKLKQYTYFQFPLYPSPREMDEMQAEGYFENFMSELPLRKKILQAAVDENHSLHIALDYSYDSLHLLGRWFDEHIEVGQVSRGEQLQRQMCAPDWLQEYIPTETFTFETVSLCMDIGIYFAETMRFHFPQLLWTLLSKPENDISYHQPVLVSFRNGYMNPFILIVNVAGKAVDGKSPAETLTKLFDVWKNFVSK